MQNKKLLKILGLIAAFLLIIFTWIVINDARNKKLENTPTSTGLENPFGTSSGENDLSNGEEEANNQPSTGEPVSPPVEPTGTTTVIVEDNPVLKQLSNVTVAGFAFTTEEREIPEPDSTTPDANIVEVFDFSGYKTIKFGDKADEVVAIKTVLNRQTPTPGLIVDNNYDTDMKNAVVDFQNRSSLTGDGVIGSKTYAKLNAFQGITTFVSSKKSAKTETVLLARYVESASGVVYDKAVRKSEEAVKRTNNNIPGVVEAFFNDTASSIVMRYLKDRAIQTYVARLTFPKIDPKLTKAERDAISKIASVTGEYLPENIKTIDVSTDGKSLFYLAPTSGGVSGSTYTFATKAKKQVFTSALSEWIADFATSAKINLTTKSSGLVDGYSYSLFTQSGTLSKNVGDEKGLVSIMSPDGKKLLYSNFTNGVISTFIMDIASGKRNPVSPGVLAEKCIWTKDSKEIYCTAPVKTPGGTYPDDWYKGKVTFDDALWNIDVPDLTGNIIYDFTSKNNVKLDAVNLQLNASEDYLGFINKKDGTLWGFDLSR